MMRVDYAHPPKRRGRVRRAILWARVRIAYWRAYESLTVWQATIIGLGAGAVVMLFTYWIVFEIRGIG